MKGLFAVASFLLALTPASASPTTSGTVPLREGEEPIAVEVNDDGSKVLLALKKKVGERHHYVQAELYKQGDVLPRMIYSNAVGEASYAPKAAFYPNRAFSRALLSFDDGDVVEADLVNLESVPRDLGRRWISRETPFLVLDDEFKRLVVGGEMKSFSRVGDCSAYPRGVLLWDRAFGTQEVLNWYDLRTSPAPYYLYQRTDLEFRISTSSDLSSLLIFGKLGDALYGILCPGSVPRGSIWRTYERGMYYWTQADGSQGKLLDPARVGNHARLSSDGRLVISVSGPWFQGEVTSLNVLDDSVSVAQAHHYALMTDPRQVLLTQIKVVCDPKCRSKKSFYKAPIDRLSEMQFLFEGEGSAKRYGDGGSAPALEWFSSLPGDVGTVYRAFSEGGEMRLHLRLGKKNILLGQVTQETPAEVISDGKRIAYSLASSEGKSIFRVMDLKSGSLWVDQRFDQPAQSIKFHRDGKGIHYIGAGKIRFFRW